MLCTCDRDEFLVQLVNLMEDVVWLKINFIVKIIISGFIMVVILG